MDRLTDAAQEHLATLALDACVERRVLEIAAALACAEIAPEHVDVAVHIEAHRRERDLTSAA
jgi:hypothetical protein